MDLKRKKELLDAWENRRPEMGVISISCRATGDVFLNISSDTKFGFNRHRFQLSAAAHPNRQLQALWDQYGENGFDYSVAKVLKYENPKEDHTDELTVLLEECLSEIPRAKRL